MPALLIIALAVLATVHVGLYVTENRYGGVAVRDVCRWLRPGVARGLAFVAVLVVSYAVRLPPHELIALWRAVGR